MKPSVGNLRVEDTGSTTKRCFSIEPGTVRGSTEVGRISSAAKIYPLASGPRSSSKIIAVRWIFTSQEGLYSLRFPRGPQTSLQNVQAAILPVDWKPSEILYP